MPSCPRFVRVLLTACLVGASLASCGGNSAPRVINVPGDKPTISEAVKSAHRGDTVLIAPGTYRESVTVDVSGIVIRGTDRNGVVLDGGDTLSNGILVTADGVRVENLTVHSYTQNGVVFNGILAATKGKAVDPAVTYGTPGHSLVGYAARYVTSYNNGLYGIYAFASTQGTIEDSYVSGNPDSGLYVGQCKPCDTVVRRVTAENNAIGYYGTNASGNVWVIDSVFRGNRLGMAPNSQKAERLAPQEETVIAGNLVADNDNPAAPHVPSGFFGGGVAVGGGTRNLIVRNRVTDHSFTGIILTMLNDFMPENNRIEGNVLSGNGIDLAYSPQGAVSAAGNCFTGNSFTTSTPTAIEQAMPCDGTPNVTGPAAVHRPVAPPHVDYRTIPAPGPQPSMPTSSVNVIAGTPPFVAPDLAAIKVPS